MADLDLIVKVVDQSKRGLAKVTGSIDNAEKKTSKLGKAAGLAGAAVGGIAVAGAAIAVNLVGDTVEAAKEIDNLAKVSQLGVEELQAMAAIAAKSGGNIEDVADASREMQLRLTEATRLGSGPAIDALGLLGVSLDDIAKLKPDEQFALIRDRLSEVEDPALRAFAAEELLGGSSERLAEFIDISADAFDKQTEAVKQSGRVMSEDMVEGNVAAGEALDGALGSVKGVISSLVSGLAPVLELVATLLNTVVVPAIQWLTSLLSPLIDLIVAGLTWALENVLLPAWEAVFGWAKGTFLPFFEKLGPKVGEIWDAIVGFFSDAWTVIRQVWDVFAAAFGPIFSVYWTAISNVFKTVFELVKTVFGTAWNVIKGIWDVFAGLFTGDWGRVWDGVKGVFTAVWDGIVAAFGHVANGLAAIWDGIKDKVGAVWDAIVGVVKGAVNVVIGFINRLIGAWNSIKLRIPEVRIPKLTLGGQKIGPLKIPKVTIGGGSFGGQTFGVPQLPKIPTLAEGGIVKAPTLALVGEAGPEAVVPLGRGGFGQPLTVRLELDGSRLGEAVISSVNQAAREGTLLLSGSYAV